MAEDPDARTERHARLLHELANFFESRRLGYRESMVLCCKLIGVVFAAQDPKGSRDDIRKQVAMLGALIMAQWDEAIAALEEEASKAPESTEPIN